jgi:hypothetical protein
MIRVIQRKPEALGALGQHFLFAVERGVHFIADIGEIFAPSAVARGD